MKEIRTEDAVGHILCHDITQIIKDVKKGVLFKKGHIVREEDIPQIIKWAIKEANPVYPVPQIWGEKDFREVLKNIKGES